MNKCSVCGNHLQGMDKEQLASGKCKNCYSQTYEGQLHYQKVSRQLEARFGENWRSIVQGFGDQ